jgi:hypothetical protein
MKRQLLAAVLALASLTVALPDTAEAHVKKCKHGLCKKRHPPKHRYVPAPRPRRVVADDRAGMYLGIGLLGDFVTDGGSDLSRLLNTGGGLDVFLGLRFGPAFALEFGMLGTVHSTDEQLHLEGQYERGVMNGCTLDAKIFLLPDSVRVEPFLQIGAGAYAFYQEGYAANEFTGGGFHAGGGVDLAISSALAFGVRGLYKGVYLDNATEWYPATESLYVNQFTVEGNIQLRF